MLTQFRPRLILAIGALLTLWCGLGPRTPTPEAALPNPASVHCEQQGNRLEIITAADGSQTGECVFPDGTRCEEWAFYRGECPAPSSNPAADLAQATPTIQSTEAFRTQDWPTYAQSAYGFSLKVPPGWVVDAAPDSDPLLGDHLLFFHPAGQADGVSLRVTFRRLGEQTLLWPTGVGQGDFVPGQSLPVAGGEAVVMMLRCPTGEITSLWFHGSPAVANIQRGNLEFGFLLSASSVHCAPGQSLEGEAAQLGELIVQSLTIN